MDVLSVAIAMMRTGRPYSNRLQLTQHWCYRFGPYDGAGVHILLHGTAWVIPEHGKAIRLNAGDVVLVPHGSPHHLSDTPDVTGAVPVEAAVGGDGPADFLCGKYRLDRSRVHPLLAGLPDIVHLPGRVGTHPTLHGAIDLLASEINANRQGQSAALTALLDLLLVYTVRGWLDGNAMTGWPRALHDPQIAAALEALHDEPAAPWRVQSLAERVNLSRATLSRRFTALTGQSPIAYLTWWRMVVAAQLLRETDRALPGIAAEVGYGSPYAFSHAFKRQFGLTPGRYRTVDLV